jgi:hypothetical protein
MLSIFLAPQLLRNHTNDTDDSCTSTVEIYDATHGMNNNSLDLSMGIPIRFAGQRQLLSCYCSPHKILHAMSPFTTKQKLNTTTASRL